MQDIVLAVCEAPWLGNLPLLKGPSLHLKALNSPAKLLRKSLLSALILN